MKVKSKKLVFAISAMVFVAAIIVLAVIQKVRTDFLYNSNQVGDKIIQPSSRKISTIIVPHFDNFKTERQKFLDSLSSQNPQKIIIASVNHFNAGEGDIITTDEKWDFSGGAPAINNELFDALIQKQTAAADDTAFENEHGIKKVYPEIFGLFPKAKYLPIIVRDKTPKEKIDNLANELYKNCPDCLLVASIDFSHYNPDSLAQIHDEMSLAALNDLDEEKAWKAETDSPQILTLAIQWAKKQNTKKFNLNFHLNSGQQSNSSDLETTSVIIGSHSSGEPEKTGKSTTFVFAGDGMFDRLVYHNFKSAGLDDIFKKFSNRVFWGVDLSMVNLEGPISDSAITDDITSDNLIFNFPSETAKMLKNIKINAVSLANNHTSNAGVGGFETTKKILDQNSIKYAGTLSSIGNESVLKINGEIPISVVAVNILSAGGDLKSQIADEKAQGRFVIIYPHWGSEYKTTHSSAQSSLAHAWIDSGADMIIGSHPHVVQDVEIYKGKPIVYSLGNFVFDQIFSRETQQGLILAGVIRDKSLDLTFLPTKQVNLRPQLTQSGEKSTVVNNLLQGASEAEKIRSDTIRLSR